MCNDQVYDCLHWLPKNTFVFPRQSKIMFAWAKHAQPTELPDDVGFSLQPDEYLVLQVCCTTIYISFHFLTLSTIAGALCKTPTKRSQWSVCDGETGKADLYSRWYWLWVPFGGIKFDISSRHVPSAPVPFGNSSFHTCRAWRCQLPSKLEVVLIPLEHWLENYLKTFRSPIHVFAYRTHAHSLGSVISGYR